MSKPEKVFKIGAVRASIFRNTIERQGKQVPLPKVILEVRYLDKSGQWKGTNSLSLNEVPKAILALQKAFEYLTEKKEGQPAEDRPTEETVESPKAWSGGKLT
jgi:hypothetical protein